MATVSNFMPNCPRKYNMFCVLYKMTKVQQNRNLLVYKGKGWYGRWLGILNAGIL